MGKVGLLRYGWTSNNYHTDGCRLSLICSMVADKRFTTNLRLYHLDINSLVLNSALKSEPSSIKTDWIKYGHKYGAMSTIFKVVTNLFFQWIESEWNPPHELNMWQLVLRSISDNCLLCRSLSPFNLLCMLHWSGTDGSDVCSCACHSVLSQRHI